ncbi:MAG: hypothetical protein E7668_03625 [Ruminococcaceae bacterium]|nr:hypothetical protein [Oscillospiraceae bacterium]
MKYMNKRLFAILAALLCLSLCLTFVGCGDDPNEGETANTAAGTAAGTEASTDTSAPDATTPPDDDDDEKEPSAPATKTELPLDDIVENVRMLNSRDRAAYGEISCDFIGSGIAFRLNNAGGDVTVDYTLSADASCTFLVKVDGQPFNMNGSPYIVVSEAMGTMTIAGLPTGEHDIELVKVSGYAQGCALLHKLTFFGTLVEKAAPSTEDFKIEILDENALNIAVADGKGSDATLSYAALLDGYEAEISMLDFGDAGLLGTADTVIDRYPLRSPDRSASEQYDFSDPANLVIVNIGAVDYAASETPADNADAFAEKYRGLLNLIRAKNGMNCRILCLYSAGEGYGEQIQSVCDSMPNGIYSMAIPADYLADGVLSAAELEPQKEALKALIDTIIEDINTVRELKAEQSGSGIEINYSEFA